MNSACACGSHREFDVCCGPLLAGQPAPTAEALMRSRYTAFTRGDMDYLEKTNSKRAAAAFNRADLEMHIPDTEWLGMEVKSSEAGGENDDTGIVVFSASYRYKGRTSTQIETSEFVRVKGEWRYDWGNIELEKKQPNQVVKIGRNDPCMCGSGQKYKKCCGK